MQKSFNSENCIKTFLGHFVEQDGLGKDLITGIVSGTRKIGKAKVRYKDNIKDFTN